MLKKAAHVVIILFIAAAAAIAADRIVQARVQHRLAQKVRVHIPVRPLPPFLDIMIDEVRRPTCDAWITIKANGVEERCI